MQPFVLRQHAVTGVLQACMFFRHENGKSRKLSRPGAAVEHPDRAAVVPGGRRAVQLGQREDHR